MKKLHRVSWPGLDPLTCVTRRKAGPKVFALRAGLQLSVILLLLGLPGCGKDSGADAVPPPQDGGTAEPDTAVVLLQETLFSPDWGHTGAFAGARTCAACHEASAGAPDVMVFEGKDVSPYTGWRHSMMAQGFADPYFQAKLAHEAEILPHLAGLIEDKCLTCHTPMGRTHDLVHSGAALSGEYYRFQTALDTMYAREGISCTVCHQVLPDGLGEAASFSGAYLISPDLRNIHGPFERPVGQIMQNDVNYRPVYGEHMKRAALCAACHTLFTPVVDPDTGLPTGDLFPEQTPFVEWSHSIYAQGQETQRSCQHCHMPTPASDYRTLIATRRGAAPPPPPLPEREPFRYHAMIGGNTHVLAMLAEFRDLLGLDHTSIEGFEGKIEETRSLLEGKAATL
ncbi:MAG: cytochrome c family protein, partial [Thioalkalivibrio sp.]|nr:cytochrome c family protein [Thioalkalivibrio sp.]